MADSRLARRLGCTDGQVWTLGIVVALALTLVPATFPAGLRPQGDTLTLPAADGAAPVVVVNTPIPFTAVAPVLGLLPPIPLPGTIGVLGSQSGEPTSTST